MLNKLAPEIARWLFWLHDAWGEHRSVTNVIIGSRKQKAFRNVLFMTAIWVSYMLGVHRRNMDGFPMESRCVVSSRRHSYRFYCRGSGSTVVA